MKATQLLSSVHFHDANPGAEPVYVDKNGRAILFALQPGQSIKEHDVPNSPFYAVVLQGHGFFAGADGRERRVGPDDFVEFDPGEPHTVRAGEDNLVFLGILHGAQGNTSNKVGGDIGHAKRHGKG